MYFKRNAMHIENWEKGRCVQRLLVTNFNEPKNPDDRNLGNNPTYMQYKERGFWLIIA